MLLFNWLTLQKLIVIVKLTVNVVKKSLLNFIDINQSILFVLFSLCLTLQISLVRRINSKCLADTIQTKVWGFSITILLKDSCFCSQIIHPQQRFKPHFVIIKLDLGWKRKQHGKYGKNLNIQVNKLKAELVTENNQSQCMLIFLFLEI